MAATGYTPIYLYYSSSAGNTPSAANLGNGELAINIADGKLFYKDSGGNVQTIASKSGNVNVSSISFGTTGLTPSTATTGAVTVAGTLAIANGGSNNTSFTAKSGNVAGLVFFDGTKLANDATVTDVGYDTSTNTVQAANLTVATNTTLSNLTASKTVFTDASKVLTTTGTVATSQGGTGLTSFTANGLVYASSTSALTTGSSLTYASSILTTPLLSVSSASAYAAISSTTAGNARYLLLNNPADSNSAYVYCAGYGMGIVQADANAASYVYISTQNTERMRVFGSGGVSIGNTTDPGATNLSVTGSATIQGLTVGLGAGSVTSNTVVGNAALASNSTGLKIVAIGYQSLNQNTGSYGTSVGYQAGYNNTGSLNTYFGYQAGYAVTSGVYNTYVGPQAGGLAATSTGERNIGVGDRALGNITSGSNNIGIGFTDNVNGYAPVFDVTTENNRISLGTTGVTNAYIKVAWTVTSDQRDKTNIVDLDKGLDFVNELKPKQYQFKVNRKDETPTGNVRYGFLAQDILSVEGSNPVIVDNEDEEHLKYNGESLVPVLVKAIQELQSKLKAAGIAGF